ncbi:MAG: CAP domain-containing protein [Acidobacteriota bacterium]
MRALIVAVVTAACAALRPPSAPTVVRVASEPTGPWAEAKRASVDEINAARVGAGLSPLAHDAVLERAGDAFCRALVAQRGSGHVARDGAPPYLRVLLAGGDGYHRQNVGTYDSTATVGTDEVPAIAVQLVRDMLAEVPPDDGHRATILDPTATHLGVGVAAEGGRVRISHEVACRGAAAWAAPPEVAPPRQLMRLAGRLAAPWRPAAVEVLWEPLPAERADTAPPVRVYGYPTPRYVSFVRVSNGSQQPSPIPEDLVVGPDDAFQFTWRTGPEPGVEVIVVWARRRASEVKLTPVAAAAVVVTPDAALPPNLRAWADLRLIR